MSVVDSATKETASLRMRMCGCLSFLTARGAPPPRALARRLRASLGPQAPRQFLPAHNPRPFTDDDELVGFDPCNRLRRTVRPAHRHIGGRCRTQSEMQTAVVGGVKAGLRGD